MAIPQWAAFLLIFGGCFVGCIVILVIYLIHLLIKKVCINGTSDAGVIYGTNSKIRA